jgi:hypothetical protein
MEYALLFYHPPATEMPPAERGPAMAQMLEDMRVWLDALRRAGVYRSTLRLAGPETASSLRGQGSDVLVTDGPFAETKEVLGGFALIDCPSRDEALRWARSCPLVRIGTIEVRSEAGPRS